MITKRLILNVSALDRYINSNADTLITECRMATVEQADERDMFKAGVMCFVGEHFREEADGSITYYQDNRSDNVKQYKHGMIMPIYDARYFFMIKELRHINLHDIPIEDIKRSGFSTLEEFKETWDNEHRKFKNDYMYFINPVCRVMKIQKLSRENAMYILNGGNLSALIGNDDYSYEVHEDDYIKEEEIVPYDKDWRGNEQ